MFLDLMFTIFEIESVFFILELKVNHLDDFSD